MKQKLIQRILNGIRGEINQAEFSRKLGFEYNVYNRWETLQKVFYWKDFVSIASIEKFNIDKAFLDTYKIKLHQDYSDKNVLRALTSLTSRSDLSHNILHKQKYYKVIRGNRKLKFQEFLLLSDVLSRNTSRFFSHFLSKKTIEEVFLPENEIVNQSILSTKSTLLIMQALGLESYKSLKEHSDHFLSDLVGVSIEEVQRVMNQLELREMVAKIGKRYELQSTSKNIVLSKETSLDIHQIWRKDAYLKGKNKCYDNFKGTHLLFKTSKELDEKVIALNNRYFNDLRLLIQDYESKDHSFQYARVISLNFLKYLDIEN